MRAVRFKAKPLLLLTAAAILLPSAAAAQTSPAAYRYATRHDLKGRVTGTIAPDPDGAGVRKYAAVRNTYDDAGRLTKVEKGELSTWQDQNVKPENWGTAFAVETTVETTYDALDRKTVEQVRGSDGVIVSVTQFSYDVAGRPECTAVRMNPAAFGSLPASACTQGTQGSNGPDRITRNIYDKAGQLLQVRKAVGTGVEIADATYTYTDNGKKKYVIDANGNRAELHYDGYDRLDRWTFPSTTRPAAFDANNPETTALSTAGNTNPGDYEAYAYDANGNRTWLRKRDGSELTYEYDALNRMTRKIVPDRAGLASTHERSVYYGYDSRSLPTYVRFDSTSGEGVTSVYDGLGRLTSTTEAMDGQSRTLSYQYDADGNRTRITWPDAAYVTTIYDGLDRQGFLVDAAGSYMTSWTYAAGGQLALFTRKTTAFDQSFGYDPVGRLSGLSIVEGQAGGQSSWSFTRNPAGQIASETRSNDAYAWTSQTNGTLTYTTNGLNQYATIGGAAYCHDDNGNLTADGGHVYLYDIENRLVEKRVQTNTTCTALSYSGTLVASLRYDPLGRLHEVTDAGTVRFLYDGDALVGEYNTSGSLLRRYMHGSDAKVDDPVIWFEGTSAASADARYLYADPRGSIVLTGDGAGNAVAINSYDEYGYPGAGNQGRFQYTGQVWLPALGMYHYKARVYSPVLGRFLQTDPVGYDDQINLYAYVGNDPVNRVDPSGMATVFGDTMTGSHLKARVEIDADFDNDGTDDLSKGQLNSLGREFSGFISANNGANLSSSAATITGGGTIRDKAMTSAVSQFVGSATSLTSDRNLQSGWQNLKSIWLGKDPEKGDPAWSSVDENRMGIDPTSKWFSAGPSNIARMMLHETYHLGFGDRWGSTNFVYVWGQHSELDDLAKKQLMRSGLGGGGCLPRFPFSGC